jgi:hypothetical protein
VRSGTSPVYNGRQRGIDRRREDQSICTPQKARRALKATTDHRTVHKASRWQVWTVTTHFRRRHLCTLQRRHAILDEDLPSDLDYWERPGDPVRDQRALVDANLAAEADAIARTACCPGISRSQPRDIQATLDSAMYAEQMGSAAQPVHDRRFGLADLFSSRSERTVRKRCVTLCSMTTSRLTSRNRAT